jgi:hypothetical protein
VCTRKTTKAPLRTQNSYAVIDGNDPDFEEKQKAAVILFLVDSLMGNDSAPLPYSKTELFLELCRQSVEALDRQPESMHLSPSAPALLRYLRGAMARYVEAATTAELDSPKAWNTTLRNTSLAKALYVSDENKTGGRPKSEGHDHFAIKVLYAQVFFEMPNWNIKEPTAQQVTTATRRVYEGISGKPWEQDNTTADKLLTHIRRVLRKSGYSLPPPSRPKR